MQTGTYRVSRDVDPIEVHYLVYTEDTTAEQIKALAPDVVIGQGENPTIDAPRVEASPFGEHINGATWHILPGDILLVDPDSGAFRVVHPYSTNLDTKD